MEGAAQVSAPPVGGPRGGGYRGRGGGPPMRGGFERGRGRGMGRGHFMGGMRGGGMGGGGPPMQGMMSGPSGRGMRPRGGLGYQGRGGGGGFQPRGASMGMRGGGRPPMYQQPPKQHTGADNNKTVSPVPTASAAAGDPQSSEATGEDGTDAAAGAATGTTPAAVNSHVVSGAVSSNSNNNGGGPPPYMGRGRGRGGPFGGRGRGGGYNPHMNGSGGGGGNGMYSHSHHASSMGGPGGEHGGGMPRRGSMRGRGGGYNQALKRGAPGGPGPKRGRYEGGPYGQRPMTPKYHSSSQHMPQSSYGSPPSHHAPAPSHHGGYQTHDQSQQVDPYSQSGYSTQATAQQSYNGYGQSSGYATHTTQASTAASSSYASHHGTEYDQSQYQGYNSTGYTAQQDTRYQPYSQDYSQQYGSTAVDYNATGQTDYSQQSAGYDERAYAGYGVGRLTTKQLEAALPYCSHLVYGYMIMYGDNYQVHSYGEVDEVDIRQQYFAEIKSFKQKYPELKVLLSVGGDRDIDVGYPRKYIELLEATQEKQKKFIESAHWLVDYYGFDGLDLAYQFPRNKPRKIHGVVGSFVKSFKKIFTGNEVVDPDADKHKQQFTRLVSDLHDKLHHDGYLLSLTVLPNVNSTWYFDIPKLNKLVDFVNLGTFDFYTPERNPEEADYSAPLFYDNSEDRLPHNNVKFQTEYWNNQGFPAKKLNVGIPTHGNVWQLTDDSGNTGIPIVHHTAGPAPPSPLTNKHGLLSAPEICKLLTLPGIDVKMDKEAHITHSTLGHYGYLPAEGKSRGLWVGYDDIDTVTKKAEFALVYAGGVALFHLGHDDYLGVCAKVSYPILRSINQTFQDTINVKLI